MEEELDVLKVQASKFQKIMEKEKYLRGVTEYKLT